MVKNNEDILNFLLEQVQWHKEQDMILAKIEDKLRAMKAIAEYRRAHELPYLEVQRLQEQIEGLKGEIEILQQQLYQGVVH